MQISVMEIDSNLLQVLFAIRMFRLRFSHSEA